MGLDAEDLRKLLADAGVDVEASTGADLVLPPEAAAPSALATHRDDNAADETPRTSAAIYFRDISSTAWPA